MFDNTLEKPRASLEINGKTYKTVKEACEDLGLNYRVVMAEKNRSKRTYEEVINFKLNHDISVEIKGKTYKSMHEACRENGVKYSRLANYYKRTNTDENITLKNYLEDFIDGKIDLDKSVIINGKSYTSLQEACLELCISETALRSMLRRHPELNMSLIEAIEKYITGELEELKEEVKAQKKEKREQAKIDKKSETTATNSVPRKFITNKKIGELSISEFATKNNLDLVSFKSYLSNNNLSDIEDESALLEDYLSLPIEPHLALEFAQRNRIPYSKFRRFMLAAQSIRKLSNDDILVFYNQTYFVHKNEPKVSKIKGVSSEQYDEMIELREKAGRKIWEYNGKKYLSLQDMCDDLNIDVRAVYRERSKLASLDDDITEIIQNLINAGGTKNEEIA